MQSLKKAIWMLKPDFDKKEYVTWKPLAMQAVSLRRKEGEILKTE